MNATTQTWLNPYRGDLGVSLALETVDALKARHIPTHPANYEIWATYAAGTNPELNREIDRLIATGDTFTDEQNEILFEKFCSPSRLSWQVIHAGETAAQELTKASASIRKGSVETVAFSQSLHSAAELLETSADAEDVKRVASNIARETQDMASRSADLARALEESARQIDALQSELSTAKAQALTDSLTGLGNRRQFDQILRQRTESANAEQTTLSLMLCDIDYFKQVNDRWGHSVGDQVLRYVAHVLSSHARIDWLVARYGGEEFAIIMPRTALGEAAEIANNLRLAIGSKALTRRSTQQNLGKITVSIGVASYEHGESCGDLFKRADANLYEAKGRGRNQTYCGEDPAASEATA